MTTDWMWCFECPKEAAAEMDRLRAEVERLRDTIDCGCNAITDAVELGGPDIPRVKAMLRRMRAALEDGK